MKNSRSRTQFLASYNACAEPLAWATFKLTRHAPNDHACCSTALSKADATPLRRPAAATKRSFKMNTRASAVDEKLGYSWAKPTGCWSVAAKKMTDSPWLNLAARNARQAEGSAG